MLFRAEFTQMKTPWIKALLCFLVAFALGGSASLLWSSYAGEMPHGSTALEQEKLEKEICNEVERNALAAGLISGLTGALVCFMILKLRRNNQ